MTKVSDRVLKFGASIEEGHTSFRLWAPSAPGIRLVLDGGEPLAMTDDGGGWLKLEAQAPAGTRYQYRMPNGLAIPDPASRQQAGDVHGASVVVDHALHQWRHPDWRGRPWHEAVVYETHAGMEGGFEGLRRRLPELKALGITAVQMMPIADFPGERNWGYDGVLIFAPNPAYGTPEELKALVDEAHGLGLMMLLDVVYNHFGPDGNYWHAIAEPFFKEDTHTPWGAAIDFEAEQPQEFFIQNAISWLTDYRFDGLRFDAVQMIGDNRFLKRMAREIREATGPDRHVHLVLENEFNSADLLRNGYSAQWTDDWHHCLHVLLTGETEAYYEDFIDPAEKLAVCCRDGFAYQGAISPHGGKPRGEKSGDLPVTAFQVCLQNHDQVGNRALGERLTALASPENMRAARALHLLSPFIPMLFLGEETGSETPFLFFTHHNDELAELVREGRRNEFKHFKAFQGEARNRIPDPNAVETYEASRPEPGPRAAEVREQYALLLRLRAEHITPGLPGCRSVTARAVGTKAVVAQWRLGGGELLTLAANFGREVETAPMTGHVLFESAPGAVEALRAGRLAPNALVALLGDDA